VSLPSTTPSLLLSKVADALYSSPNTKEVVASDHKLFDTDVEFNKELFLYILIKVRLLPVEEPEIKVSPELA